MTKPAGFPKKLKIRKKSEFLKLKSQSKKFVARHWFAFFQKNGLEYPRLAISVSTSFGDAVLRNYFKRTLREQFRINQRSLPSLDIHFIAKRKEPGLSRTELRKVLHEDFCKFLHWLT